VIFATLFGSATSLGLGALQINEGLDVLFGVGGRDAVGLAILVIAVLTLCFVVSAVSGVHRGIQWLSNTNMILAVFLIFFLFVLGPTVFILDTFVQSLGGYLANLIPMSFRTASYGDSAFVSGWTIFYWAWWISWAPFVGTFIARISRGRTIREFVVGVILVPSVVSFVWFAVLGGAAINLQLSGTANISEAVAESQPAALFSTLGAFPLSGLTSADRDHPGRAVLHKWGRCCLGGDGYALLQGKFAPSSLERHRLGRLHRGGGGDLPAGRGDPGLGGRGHHSPAVGGHRVRGAVCADHDRAVLLRPEGTAC
jgi:hypothetical protein